jgi:UDP-N-acetylglucosamine transferase subunit ALG13
LGIGAVIFASVGSVLPFDRLVRAVDEWGAANPGRDVFLQIGEGKYEPRHVPFTRMMPHDEYHRRLAECSLFVAHVGMGSILQALEERKQMLLLARHRSLGEHTTDHQLHTASRFRDVAGLKIVDDAATLQAEMSALVDHPMQQAAGISPHASQELLDNIANFLRPIRAKKPDMALAPR